MSELKEGMLAPQFKGVDANGKEVLLKDFLGKKVVLYFYPKDNTSGCTAEACNLRDNYNNIQKYGYHVIGVSPDNEKSHRNFINKYSLPFNLIADVDKKIANLYGVWGEKKMYGKSYMGIKRTTFVISEKGVIEKIIDKVKTGEHTSQIIEK